MYVSPDDWNYLAKHQHLIFGKEQIMPEKEKAEDAIVKVLDLITQFGGIDGSHHKQWLLDQTVQVLSLDYGQWVKDYQDGEDGAETYEWDVGIAP